MHVFSSGHRRRWFGAAAAVAPIAVLLAACAQPAAAVVPTNPPEPTVTATPAPTVTPAPTATPQLLCGDAPETTFQDWREWAQVNAQPIEGHESWVTVYVNDLAEEAYLTASPPYPECAVIVKAQYLSEASSTVMRITVMVKIPAGYDPQNGDWWYGMYDPDGVEAEMSGKVPVCIACHMGAADTDFLFAEEVLAAAEQ